MSFLSLLYIPLFAMLWRCRGGFLGLPSTTASRIVYWAVPVALWAYSIGGVTVGLLTLVTAYTGLLLSYAPFMADNEIKHVSGMVGIGIARMAITLLPVAILFNGVFILQLLGGLAGLCYYLGWTYFGGFDAHISVPEVKLFGYKIINKSTLASSGAEWGEVFTGGGFGFVFSLITIGVAGGWL